MKTMTIMRAKMSRCCLAMFAMLAAMFLASPAFAQASAGGGGAPSLKDLTDKVNFDTVLTAIFAVAGVLVVLYVGWRGAKFVIAAVKGM